MHAAILCPALSVCKTHYPPSSNSSNTKSLEYLCLNILPPHVGAWGPYEEDSTLDVRSCNFLCLRSVGALIFLGTLVWWQWFPLLNTVQKYTSTSFCRMCFTSSSFDVCVSVCVGGNEVVCWFLFVSLELEFVPGISVNLFISGYFSMHCLFKTKVRQSPHLS